MKSEPEAPPNLPFLGYQSKRGSDKKTEGDITHNVEDRIWKILLRWPSFTQKAEVFLPALASFAVTVYTAQRIVEKFRIAFHLGPRGRSMLLFLNAGLPGSFAGLLTGGIVVPHMIKESTYGACSLCTDMRQTAISVGHGIVFPFVFSPVLCVYQGVLLRQYYIPVSQFQDLVKFSWPKVKQAAKASNLHWLVLAHFVVASVSLYSARRAWASVSYDIEQEKETVEEILLEAEQSPSKLSRALNAMWRFRSWVREKAGFSP